MRSPGFCHTLVEPGRRVSVHRIRSLATTSATPFHASIFECEARRRGTSLPPGSALLRDCFSHRDCRAMSSGVPGENPRNNRRQRGRHAMLKTRSRPAGAFMPPSLAHFFLMPTPRSEAIHELSKKVRGEPKLIPQRRAHLWPCPYPRTRVKELPAALDGRPARDGASERDC